MITSRITVENSRVSFIIFLKMTAGFKVQAENPFVMSANCNIYGCLLVSLSFLLLYLQVKLLQSLGLKSTLITDGSSPINLFSTAQGLIGALQQPGSSEDY